MVLASLSISFAVHTLSEVCFEFMAKKKAASKKAVLQWTLKKKIGIVLVVIIGGGLLALYPAYLTARYSFNRYFDTWGKKLVDLENRKLLSTQFGAAWQDIIDGDVMNSSAKKITKQGIEEKDSVRVVDGIRLSEYPSLSIIHRLNEVNTYSNTIAIVDRHDVPIATIKTDHNRARINQVPTTLVASLIAAEDQNFYTNKRGFEFESYVRAVYRAVGKSITTFSMPRPRGTSTLTQQVAKLFISDVDNVGMRKVSRSIDRKLREMRLATALRKMYTPNEILEVYVNHCVTSDNGLVGVKDIARGLFDKDLGSLSDAQCVYLSRMVKWGRNIHAKIARQCHADMPRIGTSLGWNAEKQKRVLAEIDVLTFVKSRQIQTEYGALVDLANDRFLSVLEKSGASATACEQMNLLNPSSLMRKKGNLSIAMSIDMPLQRALMRLVDSRGYGGDTTIRTDIRVGSEGSVVSLPIIPQDTLRQITILSAPRTFTEKKSGFSTTLASCDTLITNIRYEKTGDKTYRRSCFYYTRGLQHVDGQYYAYAILDSKSGKLLAYYSRDQIGSHGAGLFTNRTPNGSSTAKPIFSALMYDLGIYQPYQKWIDSVEITENVPWKRSLDIKNGKAEGVIFAHSAVKNTGYPVHNHGSIFEGCQYIFDLLSTSNNILGVENVYRLNSDIFTFFGGVNKEAQPLVAFLNRINAFGRIKNDLRMKSVTGVRVYKELARIIGVDIDSMNAYGKRIAISDSLYSVALGTLEMTLYEQAHMFNMLYNNDIIANPAKHPSLLLESIQLNGDTIDLLDTVMRYHPFNDVNALRATHLGLHKRLVSNPGDGLAGFDVLSTSDSLAQMIDTGFDPVVLMQTQPVSNFAKSGTTDDVLKPYNTDIISKKRTNFGLWNAVIRIDLSKLSGDTIPDIRDVTIACIGECNDAHTGVRDGKTLHKFVSAELLKRAGVKVQDGFFSAYEKYIQSHTPEPYKTCGSSMADKELQVNEVGD